MKTQYLGYMNGWTSTPEIVKKCWSAGHKTQDTDSSSCRCETHVYCPVCGYSYDIDSSD